jgi:hypothetical protein
VDFYRAEMTMAEARAVLKCRGINEDEIMLAFRRRSKETHPDAGGDPAAFQRVVEAKQLLLEPARRADYVGPIKRQVLITELTQIARQLESWPEAADIVWRRISKLRS